MANSYVHAPKPNVIITATWAEAYPRNLALFRKIEAKIGGQWVETTFHPDSLLTPTAPPVSAGYLVKPDSSALLTPYLTKSGRLCIPTLPNWMGGFSLAAPYSVLNALFELRDAGKLYFDGASHKGAMYSFKRGSDNG